ncbi:Na+/proline symporter [Zymobacter palmae]|uniref:Na+/proline symporter n=1 Tax=Zymobacter palmae TaxID=33074 RepID=A0A348HCN9_9GAMM|nr:Na+/proline symporter [Zymobacter palmae]
MQRAPVVDRSSASSCNHTNNQTYRCADTDAGPWVLVDEFVCTGNGVASFVTQLFACVGQVVLGIGDKVLGTFAQCADFFVGIFAAVADEFFDGAGQFVQPFLQFVVAQICRFVLKVILLTRHCLSS